MKKLLLLLLGFAIGFLVAYFCYCNQTNLDMAIPKGIITPKEAMALDEAFNSRHQLISDSILDRPDNRSAWWSLEDMEGFIAQAKLQSTALGYDMNGVRVYLGAHPNVDGQVGYTTMFMVPTGNLSLSEGKVLSAPPGNGDIPGGSGLNDGGAGDPPQANYPQ